MTTGSTPRFSEEELEACKSWLLPDVSSKNSISSVEKEALAKKQQEKKSQKPAAKKPVQPAEGESVELIEDLVSALTAEQLQEITEAAEKEGYDAGYEKGFAQGLEEGKETGYPQGFDEGISAGKKQIVTQCEQLQHIMDALLIPLESEQNQLQDILLNMVAELAKAVVLRELQLDSSHITQLVDEALKTIPIGADKFSLYLNSQDIALVEEHLEHFQHHQEKSLKLLVDDSLLPGGCRLETKQTVVDYTVEQRLHKVIDGFLHKRFTNHDTDSESIEKEKAEQHLSASTNEEDVREVLNENIETSNENLTASPEDHASVGDGQEEDASEINPDLGDV